MNVELFLTTDNGQLREYSTVYMTVDDEDPETFNTRVGTFLCALTPSQQQEAIDHMALVLGWEAA